MAPKKADETKIKVGNFTDVSGEVTIAGGDIYKGFTPDQVSVLIKQISSTFQPKKFDGRSPYKGLDVFEEEDAELFFGREKLVSDLVNRVKKSRTVFITGPSGSGKSSLVRAGLIHALKKGAIQELHSERWLYAAMKPGREPISNLALAFARLKRPDLADYFQAHADDINILNKCAESALSENQDQRFVLFIDQFEEVFTQINGVEERQALINILAHAGTVANGRVIVLFAMRSDFVSNCAMYPALNELLGQEFQQIGAMQPEELVRAIALPAKEVGLPIEDELIVRIINDMKGEPGALPLMQFALKDLFDSQQSKGGIIALTLEDYLRHGGIQKSLERHADASLASLDEKSQDLARSIFSGLIEIGRGTSDTKRTALFDELIPANTNPEDVLTVVQKLADARLIITDEQAGKDTVTISHEKLIEAWPWLKKLVDESRDLIALQNEIASDAKEWDERKRDASYIYTGVRLANAREQLEAKKLVLNGLAYEFVRLAGAQQKRRQWANRFGVAAIGIALTVAVIVFSVQSNEYQKIASTAQAASTEAVAQKRTAQANAADAQQQARIALARNAALASVNLRDKQLDMAVLLGIEANKRLDNFETQGVLFDNLRFSPLLSQFIYGDGHPPAEDANDLPPTEADEARRALSPDENLLSIAYQDGTISVWDRRQQKFTATLPTEQHIFVPFGALAFSLDGKKLAAGTDDGYLYIWDLNTQMLLTDPITGDFEYTDTITFSHNGNSLAFGGSSYNAVYLYRPNTDDRVLEVGHHPDMVSALAFNSNDQVLASGSLDGTLWLTGLSEDPVLYPNLPDLTSAYPPNNLKLVGHNDGITSLEFGKDGRTLISTGTSGTEILWALDPKDSIEQSFAGNNFTSARLSPDGKMLLYEDFENNFQFWDMATHEVAETIHNPNGFHELPMTFSPDGNFLSYNQQTGSFTLWSPAAKKAIGQPVDPHEEASAVAYSPDGTILAIGDLYGKIALWNARTHVQAGQLTGHTKTVLRLIFSPDGKSLLSSGADQKIILWDLQTKQPDHELLESNGVMALSQDGKTLAYGDLSGAPILFDLVKYQPIGEPLKKHGQVTNLSFNKDGTILASSGFDSTTGRSEYGYETIILWDVTSGQPIGQPIHNFAEEQGNNLLTGVFNADGKTLLAYDHSGNITLWDVNVQSWIERGCKIAGRNLTRVEWAFYFPDKPYPTKPEDATCPQWPLEPEVTATPSPIP